MIFRLSVRLAQSRRLYPDDLLVVTAWTILLATAVIWQANSSIFYYHDLVDEGAAQWMKEFDDQYSDFVHFLAPLMILYYIRLWCIKFSFLVFFYNLGSKITSHRIWWWVVSAITTAGVIVSIADFDYKCSQESPDYIICKSFILETLTLGRMITIRKRKANCLTPAHIHFENYSSYVNFAVDVATDLLSETPHPQ